MAKTIKNPTPAPISLDAFAKPDQVLLAAAEYIDAHQFSPSYNDISERTGIRSKSNVNYYLMKMERAGLVTLTPNVMRSLVITAMGRERIRRLKVGATNGA